MFLNNRHYDPTTGVFVSVDPLVTKTMQPYIYGAANPVTYSDPSGLCPFTGCWEAFDAWIRGLSEAAEHVQDESEVSPGELLPTQWIVRHAEKSAERSLEFNNPFPYNSPASGFGLRPGQGHYELDPYRERESRSCGLLCSDPSISDLVGGLAKSAMTRYVRWTYDQVEAQDDWTFEGRMTRAQGTALCSMGPGPTGKPRSMLGLINVTRVVAGQEQGGLGNCTPVTFVGSVGS